MGVYQFLRFYSKPRLKKKQLILNRVLENYKDKDIH